MNASAFLTAFANFSLMPSFVVRMSESAKTLKNSVILIYMCLTRATDAIINLGKLW